MALNATNGPNCQNWLAVDKLKTSIYLYVEHCIRGNFLNPGCMCTCLHLQLELRIFDQLSWFPMYILLFIFNFVISWFALVLTSLNSGCILIFMFKFLISFSWCNFFILMSLQSYRINFIMCIFFEIKLPPFACLQQKKVAIFFRYQFRYVYVSQVSLSKQTINTIFKM